MEEKFYHTEFEEYLRDRADQYKMYPSDKVWKGIDRSMRSRRKWYWTGFVLLLSGISYFAITELASPSARRATINAPAPPPTPTAEVVDPFTNDIAVPPPFRQVVTSEILVEDSGSLTASLDIPLQLFDVAGLTGATPGKASLLITGLEPLDKHEKYNIELSWPVFDDNAFPSPEEGKAPVAGRSLMTPPAERKENNINWLQEQVALNALPRIKQISWQLAFSPTINYRRLNSSSNAKTFDGTLPIPLAPAGTDVNKVVNHTPALGFELGSHALLPLTKRLTLKGGLQFNYSKYEIDAFRTAAQSATIALDATTGSAGRTLTSVTNINNFGGVTAESLRNQYFQLSIPVGLEFRVVGNDRLQFNVASTIQPTYLLNRNTYLITTDYKNYTKAPSLVRRWNVNAGAEAFVSYTRGGVKWQVGPQFRYQLLSSYEDAYPIKEYLMEYGIKIGITKTIR